MNTATKVPSSADSNKKAKEATIILLQKAPAQPDGATEFQLVFAGLSKHLTNPKEADVNRSELDSLQNMSSLSQSKIRAQHPQVFQQGLPGSQKLSSSLVQKSSEAIKINTEAVQ